MPERRDMGKKIRRILMIVLLLIFLGSVASILLALYQYQKNDRLYAEGAANYTRIQTAAPAETGPAGEEEKVLAPIVVNFAGLSAVNEDVTGWIYCEGTKIDYPVLQGADNDFYLHHNYIRESSSAASIFVDANNRSGFADANTIIYGHHMRDGSMFAGLDEWAKQEYYEDHPVMWLLTPEQDYRIDLFAGYTTSADADTYMIFHENDEAFLSYLDSCAKQSDFTSEILPDGDGRYVVLSTCAYVFDNARYVLHGKLVPVDSAGGAELP